jgi:hypothetical protein
MKRTWIFVALLMGILAGPRLLVARQTAPMAVFQTELPWATVDAVLKRCAALHSAYSYDALVSGYETGLVDVAASGSGYLVTLTSADGNLVIGLLIDNA